MAARIALIVAMADNRVIGRAGDLPWRISADLKHFKRLTMGKPMIMGRKTFESIGRALPGRTNIVVTRDSSRRWDDVETFADIDRALQRAEALAESLEDPEIMVIGGAEIYRAVLSRTDRIYLTQVHEAVEGDTFFPELDPKAWRETDREDRTDVYSVPVSFIVLDRVAPAPG